MKKPLKGNVYHQPSNQKAITESHDIGENLKLLIVHPRSKIQRIYTYRYYPDRIEYTSKNSPEKVIKFLKGHGKPL